MRGGIAIYNKYRPAKFADVLGQPLIISILSKQAKLGAFGHAYLLHGPSGTGKTTTARILAAAVNCEHVTPDGEPCGTCQSCRLIPRGEWFDLIEMDAASQRGIDDIRDMKSRAYLMPWGKCKVYIIDEAHALTGPAWQALLKILEEPPANTIFIFCTTDIAAIPDTVRSRCQIFQFNTLEAATVRGKLQHIAQDWGIALDPKAFEFMAETSAGNMRSAENLMEQCIVMQA